MWMGAESPLGYEAQDRRLIVIPEEAETVRHLFCRYVVLGSVPLLKEGLEAAGITGKCWTSSSGRCSGGRPIARGAAVRRLPNLVRRRSD